VTRDGERAPPEVWAEAVPVDPGAHRIDVAAPGRLARSIEVQIEARDEGTTIDVAIPELAPLAPAPSGASVQGGDASTAPTRGSDASTAPTRGSDASRPPIRGSDTDVVRFRGDDASGSSVRGSDAGAVRRAIALAALGAGAVAGLTGGYFGIRAIALEARSKRGCLAPPAQCSPAALDDGRSAGTAADLSTGLLAGGLALAGVGVTLALTGPTRRTSTALSAMVGRGGAALALRHQFE
jgi:hypothetical protein